MSYTVLSEHHRRAAHGRHVCQLCRGRIAARTLYVDTRIADDGTVYTWREHSECRGIVWEVERRDPDAVRFADSIDGEWFRDTLAEHLDLRQFVPSGPLSLSNGGD